MIRAGMLKVKLIMVNVAIMNRLIMIEEIKKRNSNSRIQLDQQKESKGNLQKVDIHIE